MKVVVTGSHGLIGTALVRSLEADGHDVVRLVRSAAGPGEARWDPAAGAIDSGALDGADAVVHLAGKGIGDARWTEQHKREVLDSRVRGTTLIAEALARAEPRPRVLVSASGMDFYGDRGDEVLTEESSPGTGFLADVCQRWEAATTAAEEAGVRVVRIRSGLVLSPAGGALKPLLLPFRLGLGGRIGSGRQWWSWITLADEVAAIRHLLERDDVRGPVNLTTPNPVRQADFARTLAGVLHRPAVLPTPSFAPALRLGGQGAAEMLFGGKRVVPAALQRSGFTFAHPELRGALEAMLRKG